jgi:GT2 family glycosyltransferase
VAERLAELQQSLRDGRAEVQALRGQIDALQARLQGIDQRLQRRGFSPVRLATSAYRYIRDVVLRGGERERIKSEAAMLRNSGLFDTHWYLEQYPDVGAARMDPIEHYLRSGAAEGRNPAPHFFTRMYLQRNPDVAAAGVNPLVHYVQFGQHEGRSAEGDYPDWVKCFDTWSEKELAQLREDMERFAREPLLSVIMPVYNTPREWLERAFESVLAQIYPHWELCVSDNASTLPHVRRVLEAYASKDRRIRVTYRDTNGHISVNSNSALALASGDYIALLDSDDELPPHALYWVAKEINDYPDADLIYSDEDKLNDKGERYEPYFKPDWNPALIRSQNYICHLSVFRRSLVAKVGGFREGLEGSQDHDLVLRSADASDPARIRHIPRILYHWRSIAGSTASAQAVGAKPYAWLAGARAIEDHLARNNIPGKVVPVSSKNYQVAYYQIEYPLPAQPPKVSIIMPSACKLQLLRPCMRALMRNTTYPDFEVILVVNEIRFANEEQASYLEGLKQNPKVRLLVYKDRPFNFSWLNNWAAREATGPVLCLMNDDVEVVTPDWLEKMVSRLELDGVGMVGPMLYFPDDTIQHAGVTLGIGGVAAHTYINKPRGSFGYFGRAAVEQDLSCVTAACAVLRREAFEQIGGFDEDLAVAFNDVDLCIRLREAGWRILWTPHVEHYHHESASIGRHDSPERREKFREEVAMMRTRWGSVLDSDPFHNPNLSLRNTAIGFAFPPRIAKLPRRVAGAQIVQAATAETKVARGRVRVDADDEAAAELARPGR